jgi:sialic acid synthase SpsE
MNDKTMELFNALNPEQGDAAQSVLVIAELGTAHNGEIAKAKEMIQAACEAGADCVKFQWVIADEILHPNTGDVELPGGRIPLYERFKQLELPPEFYADVKEYAESKGLLFLCTPFGLKSARLLKKISPKMVKVASPELNYTALLQEIGGWRLLAILSTGVSKLADIEDALAALGKSCPACLLHCVTAYPAPEEDYNLKVLGSLRAVFGLPVGISDHSMDPELVPLLGFCQGARVIEKHFCLSRSDPGLDDRFALPPPQFARMVTALRDAQKTGPQETLAALTRERGDKTVAAILGSGVKELAPSEKANYSRTNRSLHALRDIKPGEAIGRGDVGVLRTEKVLRPGLKPSWEPWVYGRVARSFIPNGEGIRFEDM